jgi:hypothetical protein
VLVARHDQAVGVDVQQFAAERLRRRTRPHFDLLEADVLGARRRSFKAGQQRKNENPADHVASRET